MTTEDRALVDRWLSGKKPNTRRDYANDLSKFDAWMTRRNCEGSGDMSEVTHRDLEEYREQLAGAPATKRRAIASLKSFFRFGHAVGIFDRDAGAPIALVPVDSHRADPRLSPENVGTIIRLCDRVSDRILIRTLYLVGLRATEAAALVREDLIRGKNGARSGLLCFGRHGTIWLPETLAVDLDLAPTRKGGHFFPGERAIERRVAAAGARAGIRNLTVSALRSAHRRHALERGCPVGILARTLGEAMPATAAGDAMREHGASRDYSSALYLGKFDVAEAPLFSRQRTRPRAMVRAATDTT